MLRIGDKLICINGGIIDDVTKGKVYEVCGIESFSFKIIGDHGTEIFPVASKFKEVNRMEDMMQALHQMKHKLYDLADAVGEVMAELSEIELRLKENDADES